MALCCSCSGRAVVGAIFFLITLVIFVVYLLFIEYIRLDILEDYFGILHCSQAWLDVLVDSLFEYSLLCNLLIVISSNKWFHLPWLFIYFINGIVLFFVTILQLVKPAPILWENGLERIWALVPIALIALIVWGWIIIKRSYNKTFLEYEANLCKINPRFLVQSFGGFMAISCTIFLVAFGMNIIDKPIVQKLNQLSALELSNLINVKV